MKKLISLLIILSMVSTSFGAPSEVDRAILEKSRELLLNPAFENGKQKWAVSTGSFSVTSGAGGQSYAVWDAGAASETFMSSLETIPTKLQGENGIVECNIKTPSGTATHTLTVNDGTNDLVTPITIQSSSSRFASTTLNFVFPSSGSIRAKLASTTNEPSIQVGRCSIRKADNVYNVAAPRLVDVVTVTGCAASWTTTSGTFANFGTQTGCTYTSKNNVCTAPATNVPGVKCSALDGGDYRLEYEGRVGETSGGVSAWFRFSDGTNTSREESVIGSGASGHVAASTGINHSITYTAPQSNVTLQVQGKTNTGTAAINGTTSSPGVFKVWYFPSSPQQVFNPAIDGWRIDANISGANPSLGTAAVSSYTGIENASLTLTNNTGYGVIPALIPCSSTNAATGTTCSVGSESVGVSFDLPKAGDVEACVSFGHYLQVNGNSNASTAFQIVETPNNAQTISQEGKDRTNGQVNIGAVAVGISTPYRKCGIFSFSSSGRKTLRLMFEQVITTGSIAASEIAADAAASTGQRDIHWDITPVNLKGVAPILNGSVTSNAENALRTEFALINAPTTITSTSVTGWISSITNNGAGDQVLNFAAGAWSSAPWCTATNAGGGGNRVTSFITAASTSSIRVNNQQNGVNTDLQYYITCTGAR